MDGISKDPPMDEAAAAAAETRSAPPPPRRRRRRWPWIVLIVLILLVVGIRVALPTAVERGVAWGSRQYLGLPARLDNADFELWNGRVVLEGITLGARPDEVSPTDAALEPPVLDPATALVHVAKVATTLSWKDLRDRTVRLTELAIDSPSVLAEREPDGRIDPLLHAKPVAQPSAEPEPEPAPAEPSEPWKIALDRFDLATPSVRLVDATSRESIVELALETFGLTEVAVKGNEFALGGVDLAGPVLQVRRELLLAKPQAAPPPTAAPAPAPDPTAAAPAPDPTAAAPAPAEPAPAPNAAPPTAAPAPSTPAQPPAKPGYHVAKVDVQRATFTWITENGPLDVAITLKATDISADEGHRFPIDVQLEIGEGRLGVVGDVGVLPPAYVGKLTWDGIPIPRILLASVPQFADWLRQAKSSGDLALDVDVTGAQGPAAAKVAGRLSFDALAVQDPKGNEITLGWQQLEVVLREVFAPIPQEGQPLATTKAVLDSVKLVAPEIRYTRPSPQLDALLGINLSGTPAPAAKKGAAKETPPPQPPPVAKAPESDAPAAPLDLQIASLEMQKGLVEALDKTVKPVARTRIRDLSLVAKSIAFPAVAVGDVNFKATLPTTAKLEVRGKLAPGNVGDFTLKLRNLDLPVFNPYSSAAAGVTIDKGAASADVKLRMRGAKMTIDNALVLHQLGVSMREPETFERSFGVPLDLALALLRDPKGDISLKIPVAIDEKGTKIGIGAVVASAIKAALVGAVTAPLKMIGAAFGGGDDKGFSLDPLPSVAGSPALADDAQGRIDGLAKMMGERPSVALDLRGRSGPDDEPEVAEQMLIERIENDQGLPPLEGTNLLSRRRIGQALERRAKGEATGLEGEDVALYERYVAAIAVPDARLAALAKSRAETVRDALVARGIPTERLSIGETQPESKPGVAIGFKSGG
jgi:hypothetical protein